MRRLALLIAALVWPLAFARATAEELLIIANPSVGVEALSLPQVSSIYLLKTTAWPDGSHIVPVNREATSSTRAKFTGGVLREDSATLAAYWNEMHFKGRLPPLVQESDLAMVEFVRRVPGAIGYISASTAPANVKVLARAP